MELHDEIERLQSKVSDIYQQQESTTLTLTNEMRRTQDLINEILKHIGSGNKLASLGKMICNKHAMLFI